MGVFSRPDSPYWWLWLEQAPPGQQKEKTAFRIGRTPLERIDSKRKAEQVYAQRVLDLASRIHRLPTARPTIRFEAFATLYKRDILPLNKGETRELEIMKVLNAAFGGELLHTIDADRVRTWMAERRRQVSASTVNRELGLLKSMLRDAVPKYLENSPVLGLKHLKTIQPKRRVLSAVEERKLLKVCTDPVDYALLVLGIDTLQRLGDLLDIRREDRTGDWIYIRDDKNSASNEVPLSARAAAALDAIPGDAPYYFAKFRQAKSARDWRGSVRQRLELLCKEAGIPFGRKVDGITFHWATRRTGLTKLVVRKKVSITVAQKIGGWSRPDVPLRIYAEAQRSDLAAAVGQRKPQKRKRA